MTGAGAGVAGLARALAAVSAITAGAAAAAAQVPVERESAAASAWELGATGSAIRFDQASAPAASEGAWTAGYGARLAWRPMRLVALGLEVWAAELDGEDFRAAGVHLRAIPWSRPTWIAEPALHFGVERLSADDDHDRSLAFVAGAGLVRIARRWTLDLAVRNHHLTVEPEADPADPEAPIDTGEGASLWEVRASLALALGGDG